MLWWPSLWIEPGLSDQSEGSEELQEQQGVWSLKNQTDMNTHILPLEHIGGGKCSSVWMCVSEARQRVSEINNKEPYVPSARRSSFQL